MNAIGDLYESICLEDLHYKDIEEYTNAVEMVSEFLNKSISLERSKRNELDDLIVINRCAAQKQGFEIGFRDVEVASSNLVASTASKML